MSFVLNGRAGVRLPLPGEHNVANALAAAAAASVLGMDLETCARGLGSFRVAPQRMEVRQVQGVKVIDDTYNANPDSMAAALTVLVNTPARKRIAVLGTMLELGKEARSAHRELGAAAACCVDRIVAVGEFGSVVAEGAHEAGMCEHRVLVCGSNEEALKGLKQLAQEGDTVLVKGSRAMRMEEIVEGLSGRTETP